MEHGAWRKGSECKEIVRQLADIFSEQRDNRELASSKVIGSLFVDIYIDVLRMGIMAEDVVPDLLGHAFNF
jgi:hypothetical protein